MEIVSTAIIEGKGLTMIKNLQMLTVFISILMLLYAADSYAQGGMGWKGSGGWGMGTAYGKMFNPETIETLSGEVVSVDKIKPIRGMSYGIHLKLKTDNGIIPVHLGPAWFIENQDIKVEPKDKVEILGSRITFDGKPAVIAAKIKKGDETLELRDENGFPVWCGWRRR
jgi:hypothetical protein